jgi:hypothetical protein
MYGKEIKKVHGPYTRKQDGRQHVVIVFMDLSKKTVSYPKYLMEQKLGRELDPDLETVDHIDRDFTNNDPLNLRVIEREKHCKEDAIHVEDVEIMCVLCGRKAFKQAHNLQGNKIQGKAGPFCSRSCSGLYGAYVQNEYMDKLGNTYEDIRKYYKLNK